jgi:hypothetical protein
LHFVFTFAPIGSVCVRGIINIPCPINISLCVYAHAHCECALHFMCYIYIYIYVYTHRACPGSGLGSFDSLPSHAPFSLRLSLSLLALRAPAMRTHDVHLDYPTHRAASGLYEQDRYARANQGHVACSSRQEENFWTCFFRKISGRVCILCSKVAGEIEPH